ncbi:uncharacterized [Tachysurus ichikawai]
MTRSASPEHSTLGKDRAYPPALEEVQRRSHVGQPVDSSELAALLARLWRGGRKGDGGEEMDRRGKEEENKKKEHFNTFHTERTGSIIKHRVGHKDMRQSESL